MLLNAMGSVNSSSFFVSGPWSMSTSAVLKFIPISPRLVIATVYTMRYNRKSEYYLCDISRNGMIATWKIHC